MQGALTFSFIVVCLLLSTTVCVLKALALFLLLTLVLHLSWQDSAEWRARKEVTELQAVLASTDMNLPKSLKLGKYFRIELMFIGHESLHRHRIYFGRRAYLGSH